MNKAASRPNSPEDPPQGWVAPQVMPFHPAWILESAWWSSGDADIVRAGFALMQRAWLSAGYLPADLEKLAAETFLTVAFLESNTQTLLREWVMARSREFYVHPGMAKLCRAIHRQHQEELDAIVAQQAVAALGAPNMQRIRRTVLPKDFLLTPQRRQFIGAFGLTDPVAQQEIFDDFVKYVTAAGVRMSDWNLYFENNIAKRLRGTPNRETIGSKASLTHSMNSQAIQAVVSRRCGVRSGVRDA